MATLELTDLYPTRYEAFDKPGTWQVFTPAEDGSFWHCRRDGKRSNVRDFVAVTATELAVYSGPVKGCYPYAEVRRGPKGTYSVEVQRDGWGKFYSGFATLGAAIRGACEMIGLDIPENCPA